MNDFKYFKNILENAEFTNTPCQVCGADENCLEGIYFDQERDVKSVCLKCLKEGEIKVYIPEYIKERVKIHLDQKYFTKNEEFRNRKSKDMVAELEKTPPVPWVQYNDWPVCCGDFTRYIGEWDKNKVSEFSPNDNDLDFLFSILDDFSKSKIKDKEVFWTDIGEDTILFVFECLCCGKKIAISQSY